MHSRVSCKVSFHTSLQSARVIPTLRVITKLHVITMFCTTHYICFFCKTRNTHMCSNHLPLKLLHVTPIFYTLSLLIITQQSRQLHHSFHRTPHRHNISPHASRQPKQHCHWHDHRHSAGAARCRSRRKCCRTNALTLAGLLTWCSVSTLGLGWEN